MAAADDALMMGGESDNRASASIAQPIRHAYDLHGLTVAVAAAFLQRLLAPLGCEPPATCDWTVTVTTAETIATPKGESGNTEVRLTDGLNAVAVRDDDRYGLAVPGRYAMTCRRSTRTVEIRVVSGKEQDLSGSAAMWMLHWVLTASKRHMVHGAMLVDAKTERSIVLFAPSGTGKTTTALALARAGLLLAGDDALVLDADRNGRGLWAVPRRIKVSRKTAELLPWLGSALTDNWVDDEQSLGLDTLPPLVSPAPPSRRWAAGLVVVLLQPNGTGHAATPITKPEALATICHDNVRATSGGVDADNAATLAALAGLIATTQVIALSVGPEPDTLSPGDLGWP